MRKNFCLPLLLAAVLILSSFTATKQELVGTWRWLHVVNTQSGEKMDVAQLTMGLAKEVRIQFKDDNTYSEMKTGDDNAVSATNGTWKVEKEGTVLTMIMDGKARPSKITSLKNDTLTVEMRGPMSLVMVKEK